MILIADSGATKTEWRGRANSSQQSIFTQGLNPYYHTINSIEEAVQNELLPKTKSAPVNEIFFYGAGCDSKQKNKVVEKALRKCFPDSSIHIYHDLLGAARACFLDKPGIACILGTGSNSCLYDGEKVTEHIPSLAFILGDEASAGYFGKN